MGERIEDQVTQISKAKEDFENIVKEYREKNNIDKLVILVDDLDRLNPRTAVELLETIKLFLDVKYCVFVLAIDYEVVVQGVREKFGSNISSEKCKSFFDKIIQLPFRMPVESYTSIDILKRNVDISKFTDKHLIIISKFIDSCIGANPRTLKRIINSFLLIECVIEGALENKDSLLNDSLYPALLVLLPLQIHFEVIYNALANTLKDDAGEDEAKFYDDFIDIIKEHLRDNKLTDDEMSSYEPVIDNLYKTLKDIFSKKDFNKNLSNAIDVTSITSVSIKPNNNAKSAATKINKVSVYNQVAEIYNGNAGLALAKTIEFLLKRFPERLDNIKKLKFIRVNEAGEKKSIFRTAQGIEYNGIKYFIATSTGIHEKINHVINVCDEFEVANYEVKWINEDGVVFTYNKDTNIN